MHCLVFQWVVEAPSVRIVVARHCGLRVAVISVVTNLAAGLSEEHITHEGTLYFAEKASHNLRKLLSSSIHHLAASPGIRDLS